MVDEPVTVDSKIDLDKLGRLLILEEKLAAHSTGSAPLKAVVNRQINEMIKVAAAEEADYAKRFKVEQDRAAAEKAKADAAEKARIEVLAKKEYDDHLKAEALERAKAQAGSPVRHDAPPLFPADSGVTQKDTERRV